jgi:ABC-type sugar transport system ATPase subunit
VNDVWGEQSVRPRAGENEEEESAMNDARAASAAGAVAPGAAALAPKHEYALRVADLSKTFGATRALRDVSIDIRAGEIHALMGQNGSGKSTLIKSLAGYHHPDSEPRAHAELDGEAFNIGYEVPEGLRFVHQDLGLVLELSAQDNLALHGGFAKGFGGRVLWHEQEKETRRLLERFGVDIDIHQPLAAATPVERTVVAIAAALQGWHGGGGLLVLDEPTAVLPHDEVERLFAVVQEVRKGGTAILYVSHRMDEIFTIADRVTILRGGRHVATEDIAALTPRSLAGLMVGEDVDPEYRARVAAKSGAPVVLELRDVAGKWLRGVDLTVHEGEILGIAGLAGAGVLELPYVITGHAPRGDKVTGKLRTPLAGEQWREVSNLEDINIALVPADRQREGVIFEFGVNENLTLSILGRLGRKGKLALREERRRVEEWTRRLEIKTETPNSLISTLSGGNQQKVVVARCLASEPRILVLCEPTAGVDIGTRVAIYDLIARLSKEGLTVIVSSSDEGDLLAMCTRIVVLRNGRVAGEFDGDGLSQQALVSAIEGGS